MSHTLLILSLMVCVGFITLTERKMLSMSQLRVGPNKVSLMGILQPILDGLKLFKKFDLKYITCYYMLFKVMSLLTFLLSLLLMICFPFYMYSNKSLMIMWMLMILGMMSFCILLMGWSSLNKYGILGSNRSLAQTLSFEINLTILLFLPFILKNKFNFLLNENYFFIILSHYYFLFFILMLLEIQRAPMDLAESESELVSGYNTEYGSVYFIFIFLSEYLIMLFFILFMSMMTTMLLLMIFMLIVIIIRSCYPRLRYDILMKMSWLKVMPINIMIWITVYPTKIF